MKNQKEFPVPQSSFYSDTKPHYELLDGLRGVAALMVVWYHVFEGFAFAQGTGIETFSHGHLGVDFFFMLSGFVISYAYDDRWNSSAQSMNLGNFFKRRLIRLHPMLVIGSLIGAIAFCLQGSVRWDGSPTPFVYIMLAFALNILFIPAYPGACYDVRGNGEMFSLNGPSWSLFFEYIGNIMYALIIRRMSTRKLSVLCIITGILWACFAVCNISGYDMLGVGWTLESNNFIGGLLRMTFPFTLGMVLARNFKPMKVHSNVFWILSLILFAFFSVPHIPTEGVSWAQGISLNSLYEFMCVLCVFPFIVWYAASVKEMNNISGRVSRFLGNLSYPLYIVHYPVMYLFYAWLIDNKLYTLNETWPMVIIVFAINISLAYVCLKLWDEPIRRWLTKRFLKS